METEKSKLDLFFAVPACAAALSAVCNIMWGSALPFIKMGYRLFQIDSGDTATIMCFAGTRFMLSALLVFFASLLLQHRIPAFPKGKTLLSAMGLGLWQTTLQYTCYYSAVALLTGALGGILNSTQSFLGVIFAHFIYGNADRMTKQKTIGCVLGFAGVLVAQAGNGGGGKLLGIILMLITSVVFALCGPWNKAVTRTADSFAVCIINLGFGGFVLTLIGTLKGGVLTPKSPMAVPVLLILSLISAAGYILWALLMKNNPVSRIAVFGLLIPVVNVLLSAVMNGEPLFEPQYIAALLLVCTGILLVNRPDRRQNAGNVPEGL